MSAKRAAPKSPLPPGKKPKTNGSSSAAIELSSGEEDEVILINSSQKSTPVKSKPKDVFPMFKSKPTTPKVKSEPSTKPIPKQMTASPVKFMNRTGIKQVDPNAAPVEYPLLQDLFQFDPSAIPTHTWTRHPQTGSLQIPYSFLSSAYVHMSATRSRLILVTVLTNVLRTVVHFQPEVLRETVYLVTNHVGPAYEGIETGIGSSILNKALKEVSGIDAKQLRTLWNTHGDPGDVAFAAKSKVQTLFPSSPLTISGVFAQITKIANLKGQGTVSQKTGIVQSMLVASHGEETRYLVRTLARNLRIGAVRLTVTSALARAFCLIPLKLSFEDVKAEASTSQVKLEDNKPQSIENEFYVSPPEMVGVLAVAKTAKEGKDDPRRLVLMERLARAEALVRKVYVRHPNYDDIIPALLTVGLPGLSEAIPISIGVPLSPMLGQITRDLGEVAPRLGQHRPFIAEWKYDGQRCQIHCERVHEGNKKEISERRGGKLVDGGKVYVRLFSRHLEDMTAKYPDITELLPRLLSTDNGKDVSSFVMDAEICAVDPNTRSLLTFQTLSNRARKDVQLGDVKVRVCIFAFDLMFLNASSLLTKTFRERRALLKSLFPPREPDDLSLARFDHVASMEGTPSDMEPIRAFMMEAIENSCEGLMIKVLDHDEGVEENMVEALEDVPAQDGDKPGSNDEQHDEEEELSSFEEEDEKKPDIKDVGLSPSKKKGKKRKALLASYEPDKRVDSWLKAKRDYGELGDSLDVVPIGGWYGQGRKAAWWSPVLLALYDPHNGTFQAMCKCMSGFTDAFYKEMRARYDPNTENCSTSVPLANIELGGSRPDVFFLPQEVWEIRGADITLSPTYVCGAGLVSEDRGMSLRFPRFLKVRTDKGIEDASTPADLAAAWRRQSARSGDKPKTEAVPNTEAEEEV